MRLVRVLTMLLLFGVLLFGTLTTAEEATPEAVAVAEASGVADIMQSAVNPDVLTVVAGIILLLVFGGLFTLAMTGLRASRDNVSPDVFQSFGDSLVTAMESTLTKLIERADNTINPYDDIAVEIGKIPVEALIKRLKDVGYDVVEQGAGIKLEKIE